jgi:hypothetical protein
MSVRTTDRRIETGTAARPGTVLALAVLLGILAIGGLQGGIAMVADPVEPLGMSLEFLEGTPVDDYFLPGLFLLGVAAASIVTMAGLLVDWEWGWARGIEARVGYRWPWLGALATGGVLLVFEVVELFMVPFHPVMHPLLIGMSVAIVALALTRSARRFLVARA